MSKEALSGLRVLEYSEFVSGPYCGKLLADLGAEVIKVEKPNLGDKARSQGPFPQDIPHPEKSGLFLYLNTNKLGVTLNVRSGLGPKICKELVKWADVVVENNPPQEMERLGFDYASLAQIKPGLVMTSLTPFGQTGPYRDYKACDLISFHVSGEAFLNPMEGIEDTEQHYPFKVPGHAGDFMAGLSAAIGTMSAVIARQVTGLGQHVDLSEQEALTSLVRRDFGVLSHEGIPFRRGIDHHNVKYPCKDGYVAMTLNSDAFWAGASEMMGNPEWTRSEICKDVASRRANDDAIWLMMAEWTKEHTVKEVLEAARGKRFPLTPLQTMKELINSELVAEREMFVEVNHKKAGMVKYPGAPYKLSETPWAVKCPAPLLGEHNEEVYCHRLGYTKEDLVKMAQAGII